MSEYDLSNMCWKQLKSLINETERNFWNKVSHWHYPYGTKSGRWD